MTPAEIHNAARRIASAARALCRDPEAEDEIEALALRVRRDALEEACRVTCRYCAAGAPVDAAGPWHAIPGSPTCRAHQIRTLLDKEAGR